MPERLLHDDAAVGGQSGVGQPLDHGTEQEWGDLQVEDRTPCIPDRGLHPPERLGLAEVAAHVREPCRQPFEHVVVDLLAARLDRLPGMLAQVVCGPVADRDADDRAAQQPAPLEAVERVESHHLRQIARDPEYD